MDNLLKLLEKLEPILKAENDDLKEQLGDELTNTEKDDLVKRVERWETFLHKYFKKQRKNYTKIIKGYTPTKKAKVQKEEVELGAFLEFLDNNVETGDELEEAFKEEFNFDIGELTALYLNEIDKAVAFSTLSGFTVKWIEDWSKDLANLMNLNTHEGVKKYLAKGIEEGKGIDAIAEEMKDLPQFSRARARTTAITEVLTAHSASHQESYMQSDAVVGKRWKHSGSKGIKPRPHHVDYSGTVVPKDKPFEINGYTCMFPRDPQLPASERVRCHCVMGPVTDETELP